MAIIHIPLTPKEREVIWHRIGEGFAAEALSDDPECPVTDAETRREYLASIEDSLKLRFGAATFIDVANEDERALVIDALEGSTWWANIDDEEPAQQGAGRRVCDRLARKLTEAFGFDVFPPAGM